MNSTVIAVVPARFAATRFPGKPLALINGKPMIEWVIEQVKKSPIVSTVVLATDHNEIAQVGTRLGAKVVMTPADCPSGTDRVFAATKGLSADWILNVQGDEPLFDPQMVQDLFTPFVNNTRIQMATLAARLSAVEFQSPHTVKVVVRKDGRALYFSRAPIGCTRKEFVCDVVFKHLGVYAYRPQFLERFCAQAPTKLEVHEGLEQLRALEMGEDIHVAMTQAQSFGVDIPEDILKIEEKMRGGV